MNRLTQLKNNCTRAIERCIQNCEAVVQNHKYSPCLDACESARLDRGVMMYSCAEACKMCIAECSKHDLVECRNCVEACKDCLEELSHRMA